MANYIKLKYQDKYIYIYMDIDDFIVKIKTDDVYKDIAIDVGKWFDAIDDVWHIKQTS